MRLTSIARHELQSQPGVFVTIRKMTEGRRIQLRAALQDALGRQEDLLVELQQAARAHDAIVRECKATKAEVSEHAEYAEAKVKFDRVWRQYRDIQPTLIDPLYVRWGVKSIQDAEGQQVTVDDEAITPDNFTELMPPEAYEEVLGIVKAAAGLTEAQEKNSESATTSNAPDGEPTISTTAPAAA